MAKQYAVRCKGCSKVITFLDYTKEQKKAIKQMYKGAFHTCHYEYEFGRVEGEIDPYSGSIRDGKFIPMRW